MKSTGWRALSGPANKRGVGVLTLVLAVLYFPFVTANGQEQTPTTLPVRKVAPDIIAPPPVDLDQLDRVAPLSSGEGRPLRWQRRKTGHRRLGGPLKPEPTRPEHRFFRPVAPAAGLIEVDSRNIALAGIYVLPPERVCDAEGGGTWPCGMRARTAFRAFLRGRAIDCPLADAVTVQEDEQPQAETPEARRCFLAGQDLAAWLAEQGWALVKPGGPYVEHAANARRERRGIFSGGVPSP